MQGKALKWKGSRAEASLLARAGLTNIATQAEAEAASITTQSSMRRNSSSGVVPGSDAHVQVQKLAPQDKFLRMACSSWQGLALLLSRHPMSRCAPCQSPRYTVGQA